MIRIAAITAGRDAPSARFRVRQHVDLLRNRGMRVEEHIPRVGKYDRPSFVPPGLRQVVKVGARLPGLARSYRADITWLQRPLIPRWQTLERFYHHPIAFDVDDAIWLRYPRSLRSMVRHFDHVIAGSAYIADWFSQVIDDITVVATAIDTERFVPGTGSERSDRFRVGWTGTSSNFAFLRSIDRALGRFLDRHDDAELFVMADREPELEGIPAGRLRFKRWRPEREVQAVASFDVGIMPLPDTEWARGKCSFKMLQYMSCGVPALVSPVGMNVDVLGMGEVGLSASSDDDWTDALEALYDDESKRRHMGQEGRRVAVERFDQRRIGNDLADLFERLA